MISDKDAKFYHENGYIVVDDVYSMAEVEAMRAVVEELVEKSRERPLPPESGAWLRA